MKHAGTVLIFSFITALLLVGCSLFGGGNDDEEAVFLRISNQTGFDIEIFDLRVRIGDSTYFQVFRFKNFDLSDGEKSEYLHIPVTTDDIVGYKINHTKGAEQVGVIRFNLDTFIHDRDRAHPIKSYILEYTSHVFVTYTGTKHQENEEKVRVRVQNVGGVDYDQVSAWLRDDEDFMGREFEIGPVAAGQYSNFYTVEDALQFTRIRVVPAQGDTVDNEPLTHFVTELSPGDYTYLVGVRSNNQHDNSRNVKD